MTKEKEEGVGDAGIQATVDVFCRQQGHSKIHSGACSGCVPVNLRMHPEVASASDQCCRKEGLAGSQAALLRGVSSKSRSSSWY